MGPPADNEYAVDPKGVQIIIPSLLYLFKWVFEIDTLVSKILGELPWSMTISFIA